MLCCATRTFASSVFLFVVNGIVVVVILFESSVSLFAFHIGCVGFVDFLHPPCSFILSHFNSYSFILFACSLALCIGMHLFRMYPCFSQFGSCAFVHNSGSTKHSSSTACASFVAFTVALSIQQSQCQYKIFMQSLRFS